MGHAAGYGIAARFVEAIFQSTELERVALLLQTLSAVGCMMGRNAFYSNGLTSHYPNVNSIIVREHNNEPTDSTSTIVRELVRSIDPVWSKSHARSGLLASQQYVDLVRDPIYEQIGPAENSRPKLLSPGSRYKSVFVLESIGSLLGFNGRKGEDLQNNIGYSYMGLPVWKSTGSRIFCATDATITINSVALRKDLEILMLSKNRIAEIGQFFLWSCIPQSAPCQITISDIAVVVRKFSQLFRRAIDFAKQHRQIRISQDAEYSLSNIRSTYMHHRAGLYGLITDYAESHILRLALIFALLDQSPTISAQHLQAANAIWAYCDQSCQILFGTLSGCTLADKIELIIRNSGPSGISRTKLNNSLGRNFTRDQINYAIAYLESSELIVTQRNPGKGRTEVRYFRITST
jgi:hypothetical protein